MKKWCVVLLVLVFNIANAQVIKVNSLFLTAQRFIENKPDFESESRDKQQIKLKVRASKSLLEIQANGQVKQQSLTDFVAYKLSNGNIFRLVNGQSMKVLESKGITLYAVTVSKKDNSFGKGNIYTNEVQYLFSVGIDSEPIVLNIYNLKKAFPHLIKFHEALDTHFDTNASLLKFDNYSGMYMLNLVFKQAQ